MPDQNILIVDDTEEVRKTFELVLKVEGYAVCSTGDPHEAIRIAKEYPIQLFFIDLQMDGMDGITLCRELRTIKPAELMFAITAYHSLFDLVAAREAGFDDYFRKPLEREAIVKAAADAFETMDRWRGKAAT